MAKSYYERPGQTDDFLLSSVSSCCSSRSRNSSTVKNFRQKKHKKSSGDKRTASSKSKRRRRAGEQPLKRATGESGKSRKSRKRRRAPAVYRSRSSTESQESSADNESDTTETSNPGDRLREDNSVSDSGTASGSTTTSSSGSKSGSGNRRGKKNDTRLDILDGELQPIAYYMRDRAEMVTQMLASVTKSELKQLIPKEFKKLSLETLAEMLICELEVMSKKRIRCTLEGRELSSSSESVETDSADEEEMALRSQLLQNVKTDIQPEQAAADSTTVISEAVTNRNNNQSNIDYDSQVSESQQIATPETPLMDDINDDLLEAITNEDILGGGLDESLEQAVSVENFKQNDNDIILQSLEKVIVDEQVEREVQAVQMSGGDLSPGMNIEYDQKLQVDFDPEAEELDNIENSPSNEARIPRVRSALMSTTDKIEQQTDDGTVKTDEKTELFGDFGEKESTEIDPKVEKITEFQQRSDDDDDNSLNNGDNDNTLNDNCEKQLMTETRNSNEENNNNNNNNNDHREKGPEQMQIWNEWLARKQTSPEYRGILDHRKWLATDRGSPENVALAEDDEDPDENPAKSPNEDDENSDNESESPRSDFWKSDVTGSDNDNVDDIEGIIEASNEVIFQPLAPGVLLEQSPERENIISSVVDNVADEIANNNNNNNNNMVEMLALLRAPPPPPIQYGDPGFNPYRDASLSLISLDRLANEVTEDGGWRIVSEEQVQGCVPRPKFWPRDDDEYDRDPLEEGEIDEEENSTQPAAVKVIRIDSEDDQEEEEGQQKQNNRNIKFGANSNKEKEKEEGMSTDASSCVGDSDTDNEEDGSSESPMEGELGPDDEAYLGDELLFGGEKLEQAPAKMSRTLRPPVSDEEGFDEYEGAPAVGDEQTNSADLLPPGIGDMEPVPGIQSRLIEFDDQGLPIGRKRTTIVSVKQLYKQIKRQRDEVKEKVPDKIYTAEEESRVKQLKEKALEERKLKKRAKIRAEKTGGQILTSCGTAGNLQIGKSSRMKPSTPPPGIEWDYPIMDKNNANNDNSNNNANNDKRNSEGDEAKIETLKEWPVVEAKKAVTTKAVTKVATKAVKQQLDAKKKPSLDPAVTKPKKLELTEERLAELEQKRKEHEVHIKQKMEVLSKLKAQRCELQRREKRVKNQLIAKEKVKKESAPELKPCTSKSFAVKSGTIPPVLSKARTYTKPDKGKSDREQERKRKSTPDDSKKKPNIPPSDVAQLAKRQKHGEVMTKSADDTASCQNQEQKVDISEKKPNVENKANVETKGQKGGKDMEMLELEMRARAIKALMNRQD